MLLKSEAKSINPVALQLSQHLPKNLLQGSENDNKMFYLIKKKAIKIEKMRINGLAFHLSCSSDHPVLQIFILLHFQKLEYFTMI